MKRTEKNMPDYYQVKVIDKNNPTNFFYGLQDHYHKEAKNAWIKENALLIEDAVSGKPYKISMECFNVIPIEFGDFDMEKGCHNDEYARYVHRQFIIAQKKSNALKGLKVGKLFRLGVADGLAYYEVTKVNKGSCHIEWRGFGADRYFDQVLGGGGSFPNHVIKPLIHSEEGMRELFA